MELARPWARWVLGTLAVLQVLLMGGLIFGWSALQGILLHEESVFPCENDDDDDDDDDDDCESYRLRKLNYVYIAGVVAAQLNSYPIGCVLDAKGPKITTLISALSMVCGMLLLSTTRDSLLILSYIFMGAAAPGMLLSTFHVGNLWADEAMLIAIVNGAFDGSASVFSVMSLLYSEEGLSLHHLCIGYCLTIGVSVMLVTVFVWPKEIFERKEEEGGRDSSGQTSSWNFLGNGNLTFKACLRSNAYMLLVAFFAAQFIGFNFFLSSIFSTAPKYVDWFSIILPAGSIFSVFSGEIITRGGFAAAFSCCNFAGIMVFAFRLTDIQELQVVSMLCFIVFRSLLFSSASAFITAKYGFAQFGKMWGVLVTISAATGVLSGPMFEFSLRIDSFRPMDSLLVVLGSIAMFFPLLIWKWENRGPAWKKLPALGARAEAALNRNESGTDHAAVANGEVVSSTGATTAAL